MKKLSFICVALLLAGSAFPQEAGVKFGIKAGVNAASLSPWEATAAGVTMKMTEPDGLAIGYHAGAFANISFGKLIGFQPELLFSMQGGNQKFTSLLMDELDDMQSKFTCQFGYVHVPLLLEVKPVSGLGILVGPQAGYNVIRKMTYTYEGRKESVSGKEFDDENEDFKKFDLALVLGLQYTVAGRATVGARYNLGLTPTMKSEISEDGVKGAVKGWKNNVIQVSLGFLF